MNERAERPAFFFIQENARRLDFCKNDERIFVKLVKSLTSFRTVCKIETVTACERKAGL